MKAWIGKSVIAIGLIHSIFGLVVFRPTIATLLDERLLNTVDGQPDRERVFWFLFTGFAWLILGALIDWMERSGLRLPRFSAWVLLVMTGVGVVIMPKSGFWLFVIPTIGLFRRHQLLEKPEAVHEPP